MKRNALGWFEISDSYSKLTIDNSHGNIEFSYSDNDGYHACFTVDPDDLRAALDALAPKVGGEKC